uniref:Uncharacterized protein n=1 Tax=Zea mays TaxID=4577 RepID=B8A3I7_MAIZE|nr:unknown [Zea mays]ACR35789.1 unknown [Zea mays]
MYRLGQKTLGKLQPHLRRRRGRLKSPSLDGRQLVLPPGRESAGDVGDSGEASGAELGRRHERPLAALAAHDDLVVLPESPRHLLEKVSVFRHS